jgi:hypothetical protein
VGYFTVTEDAALTPLVVVTVTVPGLEATFVNSLRKRPMSFVIGSVRPPNSALSEAE